MNGHQQLMEVFLDVLPNQPKNDQTRESSGGPYVNGSNSVSPTLSNGCGICRRLS